jgi:glycosyltransferase involved in cell wall biosynthesis
MRRHPRRVCVVGPGTRFLSGITYYTYGLCRALSARFEVSAILMRQLLPTRLYPGRARVGAALSDLALPHTVRYLDGVDWFWIPTLGRALWLLARRRPDVLILQWWTGTVLHTYLALALVARALGSTVLVEFHEVLDPGEDDLVWASRYVRLGAPRLFRLASGYVVHSEHDRRLVTERYGATTKPMAIIPHATYDHYRQGRRWRAAPEECCNLLYFGLIRPYKGVEDLIRAFDTLAPHEIDRYWLTVVGETWEGWTMPGELIARSRYRSRIHFVNRYVRDEEVDAHFGGADVVVLPYRRSAQSGTLHVAMHYGLPVVVTAVGGLTEAVAGYGGAVLAEPASPTTLAAALRRAADLRGRRFAAPRSWADTARHYHDFLDAAAAGATT